MNSEFFDFKVYQVPQSDKFESILCENAETAVIVYKADYEVNQMLLSKICTAVDKPVGEVSSAYILEQESDMNLTSVLAESVKWVLVFGINPARLGLNASFKAYYFYPTETYNILFAHSLQKLEEHLPYKKSLWSVLQKTFR